MRKHRIKPYYSYYHYKKKKRIKMSVWSLVSLVIVFVAIIFMVKKVYVPKQTLPAIQQNIIGEDVFLESQAKMYGVFMQPTKVKGIYIPPSKINQIEDLINNVQNTQINTFVIDIKDDYGYLTFASENKMFLETGSVRKNPPIKDLKRVMDALYDGGIYPIARIVAFKDDIVGLKYPKRVISNKEGQPYFNRDGQMWLNPYDKENWEYLLEISKEAIHYGFKEIQFDYIRFHESMNSENVILPQNTSRTQIITEFMAYMSKELKPYGVYVSMDVFGTIITSQVDAEIVGQDYKELVKVVDYIYPMIYPSHYGVGSFGVQYPDLQPYDIILGALTASNRSLKEIPRNERRASVRPWLQDFTATWVKPHQFYGENQIKEQIQGAKDAFIDEFILWNGAASYTLEALNIEQE
jgi:hypothetical protein